MDLLVGSILKRMIQLSNLNRTLRHALSTSQPSREELHNRHHLLPTTRHPITFPSVAMKFHKLEDVFGPLHRAVRHDG